MQFSTVFLSALALTPAEHPEQHIFALYKHKGLACARKRKRISARPRTLPRRLRLHLTAATQGRRWNQQARVGPKTGPSQVGAPWEHLVIASLPDQTGSRHIYIYIYMYWFIHIATQPNKIYSVYHSTRLRLSSYRHACVTRRKQTSPPKHTCMNTHTHTLATEQPQNAHSLLAARQLLPIPPDTTISIAVQYLHPWRHINISLRI